MGETIRVTVSASDGSGAASFDLPALSAAHLRLLRRVDGASGKLLRHGLKPGDTAELALNGVLCVSPRYWTLTPLGRAVLAHYEHGGG